MQELADHFTLDERKQRKLMQHLYNVQAQMKASLASNEAMQDDDEELSISTRRSGIELSKRRSGRNLVDDDNDSVGGRSIGARSMGGRSVASTGRNRARIVVEERGRV